MLIVCIELEMWILLLLFGEMMVLGILILIKVDGIVLVLENVLVVILILVSLVEEGWRVL